jgi:competence protein ComGC
MVELKLYKKLHAATLVEVLVALVIIMIAFTLGIGMFVRITSSSISLNQTMIERKIHYHLQQVSKDTLLVDDTWSEDSVTYEQKVEDFGEYKDIKKISISALKDGKLIHQVNYLSVHEE